MSNPEPSYTIEQFERDLGGLPEAQELQRLVDCYPTYEIPWREGFLRAILDRSHHNEMVLDKMIVKDAFTPNPQQKGGYGASIPAKLRKTAIRILYLRYLLERPVTRAGAHRELRTRHKDLISHIKKSTLPKYTKHPPIPEWIGPS